MMIGTASACLSLAGLATGASPNWTAYNDHIRGTTTGNNVSTYSITTTNGAGGPLTNYDTGEVLPAGVSITFDGSVGDVVSTMAPPNPLEGPAGTIFQGKVDFLGGTGIRFPASNWGVGDVTITFTNLDPSKKYSFRGTSIRGANYPGRWTLVTLAGAMGATPAHETGLGLPGIVTNGWPTYGDSLMPDLQALYNCGNNTNGDVVGWDDIVPNGTSFSIINSNWQSLIIYGTNSEPTYVYAIIGFQLQEYAGVPEQPGFRTQPANASALYNTPVSISCSVIGSYSAVQWYKGTPGTGSPVPGATSMTLHFAQAQPTDGGSYYLQVTASPGYGFQNVASVPVTLTVFGYQPGFSAQPQGATVILTNPVTFSCIVTGTYGSLQWYKGLPGSGVAVANATNNTLSFPAAQLTNAGYYYLQATAVPGLGLQNTNSATVYLSVIVLQPGFAAEPQNTFGLLNTPVAISCVVTGMYSALQWYKGSPGASTAIPSGTNMVLRFSSLQFSDVTNYYLVVTAIAPATNVTSPVVSLSVGVEGASFDATGYTADFTSLPSSNLWSTAGVGAGASTYTTAAQLDSGVRTVPVGAITNQLTDALSSTPAISPFARRGSNGTSFFLQTRPQNNGATLLMCTLVNNSGAPVTNLTVAYTFTKTANLNEDVEGWRTYYNLTGESNKWTYIAALSIPTTNQATYTTNVSATLTFASPWLVGAPLYLLWADDNGTPFADSALQMSAFSATPPGAAAPAKPRIMINNNLDGTVTLWWTNTAAFRVMSSNHVDTVASNWPAATGGTTSNYAGKVYYTVPANNEARFFNLHWP
ncbi:MAG: immunoglobulin domain-containing protein [Verrucomicrobia bacterium]|nr:immunoglobulin domain-containing protein [Verrucomicrobiota bacterium]